MPRLLIVSYFFPPLGGVGPQRMLRFARYLPRFGWDVTVARPASPNYYARDEDALTDDEPFVVVDTPIFDYSLPGRPHRVVSRLRRLEFPDSHWTWPLLARRRVARLAQRADAVLSSAPPFSAHLLASEAAALIGKPWIADYRDPFVGNWYGEGDSRGEDRRRLQERVLSRASAVTLAWRGIATTLGSCSAPMHEILTGFDPSEASGWPTRVQSHGRKLVLLHAGTLYGRRYTDVPLLEGLRRAAISDPTLPDRLQVLFIGAGSDSLLVDMPEELAAMVAVEAFMPRVDVLSQVREADALLLLSPSGPGAGDIVPGKLFEYLSSGRSIIAIIGPGRTAEILRETGGAIICQYDDPDSIARGVLEYARTCGDYPGKPDPLAVEKYSSLESAKQLAWVLSDSIGTGHGTYG